MDLASTPVNLMLISYSCLTKCEEYLEDKRAQHVVKCQHQAHEKAKCNNRLYKKGELINHH